ncbi:hypothetical protein F558DRAFT_04701 [Streptomyces sp. AmelKG-A3]|nr:hypothetical protein F558DRAFT_04701 [Streptomyces sp. AmelKG-A3]
MTNSDHARGRVVDGAIDDATDGPDQGPPEERGRNGEPGRDHKGNPGPAAATDADNGTDADTGAGTRTGKAASPALTAPLTTAPGPERTPDTAPDEKTEGPGKISGPEDGAAPDDITETAESAENADSADSAEDTETAETVEEGRRLTPRQARRLRIVLSSVGMVVMGVVLALRIASRSSVLVVGVYGLALILCGVVIELSRNGRTRLGSWLLGIGLVAAVAADQLLIP